MNARVKYSNSSVLTRNLLLIKVVLGFSFLFLLNVDPLISTFKAPFAAEALKFFYILADTRTAGKSLE